LGLLSGVCRSHRKLSEILYRSIHVPSIINANFNFYKCFKMFTSFSHLSCILPRLLHQLPSLPYITRAGVDSVSPRHWAPGQPFPTASKNCTAESINSKEASAFSQHKYLQDSIIRNILIFKFPSTLLYITHIGTSDSLKCHKRNSLLVTIKNVKLV